MRATMCTGSRPKRVKRGGVVVRLESMDDSDGVDVSAGVSVGVTAEGFAVFYRESRAELVRALVLAVGDRELGREAADEGFARALERWSEVSGYSNPQGWVYRVGLNWARSKLRRGRFEVSGVVVERPYRDRIPEPELLEAVEELPYAYRAVVVARFLLDWSIEDTAAALGVPEGTVKTRQHRALRRLRKKLEARG